MSWYNTVVLSYSCDEFEDEDNEDNHDCAGLRAANKWLKRQGFGALADLNSAKTGKLGSNAVLFGGCYNYLDVDAFIDLLAAQTWKHPEDVQVLFWHDNASKCLVLVLPRAVAKRKKAAKRR